MVHGILTQSGGALRITSRLGEGTSVEAWLPRSAEAALAAPAAAAASEARGSGTILVCEDIPAVRDFVVEVLEEAGYQAIATAAGAAALAVLEAETPVDLLLVDFAMPGMNGGVVARVARERRPDLPVLLVTGNFDTAALAREANGLPILRKPFGRAQLLAQLNHLLQHGRAA
jgi:CheY-like chemotaxis protein